MDKERQVQAEPGIHGDVLFVSRITGEVITSESLAGLSREDATGVEAKAMDICALRRDLARGGKTANYYVFPPKGGKEPGVERVKKGEVFFPFTDRQERSRKNELDLLLNNMRRGGYISIPTVE